MFDGALCEVVDGNMKSRYDTSNISSPRSRSPDPEKGFEVESVLDGICKGVSWFHMSLKAKVLEMF